MPEAFWSACGLPPLSAAGLPASISVKLHPPLEPVRKRQQAAFGKAAASRTHSKSPGSRFAKTSLKALEGQRLYRRVHIFRLRSDLPVNIDIAHAGRAFKEHSRPHAPPHRLGATGTYMVTAATYHKLHHFRGRERLAVLHRGLLKMAVHYGWTLEAWAVFSNHYHFIGRSPETPKTLKPMLKTLHVKLAGWVNRLDQTPGRKVWYQYRETLLTHEKSYLARLHYVHQNPVRHGLTDHATTYSWCSAGWFERIATPAMVKTLYGFKTDQINVDDDYEVSPDW